jgi:signal transduction histidine kinase
VAIVNSSTSQPPPANIEERMLDFADVAAAAVANAQSHNDLKASRARVVAAADEARRRIERDLHDGTQQRLVTIGLELRAIEAAVPPGLEWLKEKLCHAAQALGSTAVDLQEISRGLHPSILARGGLSQALKALARRSTVAVDLDVSIDRRLPERFELSLYYIVSEALTNAAKHAQASLVHVELTMSDSLIRLSIRDDGVGGADPTCGSGLIGLTDRVAALGGTLKVMSPPGEGTSLLAEIPIEKAV